MKVFLMTQRTQKCDLKIHQLLLLSSWVELAKFVSPLPWPQNTPAHTWHYRIHRSIGNLGFLKNLCLSFTNWALEQRFLFRSCLTLLHLAHCYIQGRLSCLCMFVGLGKYIKLKFTCEHSFTKMFSVMENCLGNNHHHHLLNQLCIQPCAKPFT